jgi:heme-degrading monooxygenase HmoA
MILELAEISIKPGAEAAFEQAVTEARPCFTGAEGCLGMQLHRSIEKPGLYFLIVKWATVEAHTVGFRGSPAFARWRELAAPHFADTPQVQHLALAVTTD